MEIGGFWISVLFDQQEYEGLCCGVVFVGDAGWRRDRPLVGYAYDAVLGECVPF
jgi:hypothetical protein